MDTGGGEPDATTPAPITRRRALTIGGTAVLAAIAAACRDDSPHAEPPQDPVETNGIVVDVISIDNTFRPDRIEITPGTEVRWTNRGRTQHDIMPLEGTEWGVADNEFPPGATYSHVFGAVGEVPYYCSIHASADHPTFGMVGTIVVVDGQPAG